MMQAPGNRRSCPFPSLVRVPAEPLELTRGTLSYRERLQRYCVDFPACWRYCLGPKLPSHVRCDLPEISRTDITGLLAEWRAGNQDALQSLLPLIYNELRRLAQRHLRGERAGHTLQSTALVHEAYLRMAKPGSLHVENRAHFFAVASQVMRQVLVDYARTRAAAKRDGGQRITLAAAEMDKPKPVDLVALDDALTTLGKMSPRQSRIVELRFFGGLSIEETSDFLGVSAATVERDWATAKAWLHREISGSSPP